MNNFISKYKYILILFISVFVLYSNSLRNGYGLDDEFVTGPKNIVSKGIKAIPKVFKIFHVNDESGNNYEYRPLTKVTFAIEYEIFGENIMASRLINLLLYFLSLLVLFRFLKVLFEHLNEFILFMIVLVFTFLPIHGEVVVSLKNRDVLLSFIFSFSGFIYFLKYFQTKKNLHVFIAFIFVVLAFFSKFDVLPLLFIIPLTGYQKNKISLKYVLLIIGVFLLSYILFGLVKRSLLDKSVVQKVRIYQYFENPLYYDSSLASRVSAALNSMGFYFRLLVFPNKMACYYGFNVLPLYSFTSLYALMGLGAATFLVYNFVVRFKKPDLFWYGILFFTASISMYLNFVTPAVGVVADRFLFFASVGFCIMVIYGLFVYKKKTVKFASYKNMAPLQKMIILSFLLISAFFIIKRNREWKSKLTLFETDVKKYPESVKLSLLTSAQVIIHMNDNSNIIKENEKVNKIRNSERLLIEAIRTDSSCSGCYNNIAFLFLTYERDPASALPYLRLGFKRDSTKKEIACNIGIALFRMGKPQEALPYLYKSIELDKKHDFSVPYEVLQDLYSKTNPNEGIKFLASEKEKGRMVELMNVLMGKTYFEARDTVNSIRFYKEALKINPNNKPVADFVNNLEIKYLKKNW